MHNLVCDEQTKLAIINLMVEFSPVVILFVIAAICTLRQSIKAINYEDQSEQK